MNSATEAKDLTRVQNILISGYEHFPGYRWREAILFYLNNLWAGQDGVGNVPEVWFEFSGAKTGVMLRLDGSKGVYNAHGEQSPFPFPAYLADLGVSWSQADVETGLIRFVKNDKIKHLTITLPAAAGYVLFWKGQLRGDLHVAPWGQLKPLLRANG